jgi:hypothetical protein
MASSWLTSISNAHAPVIPWNPVRTTKLRPHFSSHGCPTSLEVGRPQGQEVRVSKDSILAAVVRPVDLPSCGGDRGEEEQASLVGLVLANFGGKPEFVALGHVGRNALAS